MWTFICNNTSRSIYFLLIESEYVIMKLYIEDITEFSDIVLQWIKIIKFGTQIYYFQMLHMMR